VFGAGEDAPQAFCGAETQAPVEANDDDADDAAEALLARDLTSSPA